MSTGNSAKRAMDSATALTEGAGFMSGADAEELYAYSLGIQAYIYGFPWIYNTQLRWLSASAEGQAYSKAHSLPIAWAPINAFNHYPLASSQTQSGGCPNCDTAYSTAWLEIEQDPVILVVPPITDRFFSFELACMDADNFAYIGVASTGTQGGRFLLATENWKGVLPEGVLDVLPRSRTGTVFVLGRTGINDYTEEEKQKAKDIQSQYQLLSLANYPQLAEPPKKDILKPFQMDFNITQDAWKTMNAAMTENPPGLLPGTNQDQLLQLYAKIGVGPGQDYDRQSEGTRRGLDRAAQDGLALMNVLSKQWGKQVNGWMYPPLQVGRGGQGGDFVTRGALQSLSGMVANDPNEAVYLNTNVDSNGDLLTADAAYLITFEPGMYPPVYEEMFGFWSLTLYNDTYNMVPNTEYYTVNEKPKYQPLNGTLKVLVQKEKPAETPGTYWLEAPDRNFLLILRVYLPKPEISRTQTWEPPKIVKL